MCTKLIMRYTIIVSDLERNRSEGNFDLKPNKEIFMSNSVFRSRLLLSQSSTIKLDLGQIALFALMLECSKIIYENKYTSK